MAAGISGAFGRISPVGWKPFSSATYSIRTGVPSSAVYW